MQSKRLDRVLILNITVVVEAVLLLLATFWMQLGELSLKSMFHINQAALVTGLMAGAATALSGFALLSLAKRFGKAIKWLNTLKEIVIDELVPLFQALNFADILLIALSSGFCEEVFFRGVVQTQLGLWMAAALFGFFHCPGLRHLPYGIWAFSAGLFLGWLLLITNSIWTPICAHALSNLLVLLFLRYGHWQLEKS